jgi:hypothetical protein
MLRRNDIAKILMAGVIALGMRNISWGQQNDVGSQFPAMPVLTCRTVQLQSQDRAPVALTPVHLKVTQIKWAKRDSSAATIEFKLLRKLQTDSEGKIHLPELNPDTYYLALPKAEKFTSGAFAIADDAKPKDCMQTFMLKDRGNMIHIELAVPGEAAEKM